MAPFKFVDRVSRGLEIQQFGDGSSERDYTYIDDIVRVRAYLGLRIIGGGFFC